MTGSIQSGSVASTSPPTIALLTIEGRRRVMIIDSP
jgi:hypothetical protein